jgi:hypothetical protein
MEQRQIDIRIVAGNLLDVVVDEGIAGGRDPVSRRLSLRP